MPIQGSIPSFRRSPRASQACSALLGVLLGVSVGFYAASYQRGAWRTPRLGSGSSSCSFGGRGGGGAGLVAALGRALGGGGSGGGEGGIPPILHHIAIKDNATTLRWGWGCEGGTTAGVAFLTRPAPRGRWKGDLEGEWGSDQYPTPPHPTPPSPHLMCCHAGGMRRGW